MVGPSLYTLGTNRHNGIFHIIPSGELYGPKNRAKLSHDGTSRLQ